MALSSQSLTLGITQQSGFGEARTFLRDLGEFPDLRNYLAYSSVSYFKGYFRQKTKLFLVAYFADRDC